MKQRTIKIIGVVLFFTYGFSCSAAEQLCKMITEKLGKNCPISSFEQNKEGASSGTYARYNGKMGLDFTDCIQSIASKTADDDIVIKAADINSCVGLCEREVSLACKGSRNETFKKKLLVNNALEKMLQKLFYVENGIFRNNQKSSMGIRDYSYEVYTEVDTEKKECLCENSEDPEKFGVTARAFSLYCTLKENLKSENLFSLKNNAECFYRKCQNDLMAECSKEECCKACTLDRTAFRALLCQFVEGAYLHLLSKTHTSFVPVKKECAPELHDAIKATTYLTVQVDGMFLNKALRLNKDFFDKDEYGFFTLKPIVYSAYERLYQLRKKLVQEKDHLMTFELGDKTFVMPSALNGEVLEYRLPLAQAAEVKEDVRSIEELLASLGETSMGKDKKKAKKKSAAMQVEQPATQQKTESAKPACKAEKTTEECEGACASASAAPQSFKFVRLPRVLDWLVYARDGDALSCKGFQGRSYFNGDDSTESLVYQFYCTKHDQNEHAAAQAIIDNHCLPEALSKLICENGRVHEQATSSKKAAMARNKTYKAVGLVYKKDTEGVTRYFVGEVCFYYAGSNRVSYHELLREIASTEIFVEIEGFNNFKSSTPFSADNEVCFEQSFEVVASKKEDYKVVEKGPWFVVYHKKSAAQMPEFGLLNEKN